MVGGFLDFFVAFGCERNYLTGARFHFLQIRHRLLVADQGEWVVGVTSGDDDNRQVLINQSVGTVLHLSRRITFGVDVGDFF